MIASLRFRMPANLTTFRERQYPVAAYEHTKEEITMVIVNKFCGTMYQSTLRKTPFDVVAWHGNYAPYKYNLER